MRSVDEGVAVADSKGMRTLNRDCKECILADLEELWAAYKKTNAPELRQRLIVHYVPLVKQAIGRLAMSLPPDLEYEDLVSYGIVGLIDALARFDPRRGTGFESYARLRIKGSVIDVLRSIGLVPRSIRDRAKAIEKCRSQLRQDLGRDLTDQEVAERMGLPLSRFHRILAQTSHPIISLDCPLSFDDKGEPFCLGDILEGDSFAAPAIQAEDSEVLEALREAIRELPERERVVISLYYYEELTMKETSRVLEVSESWVSQLHARAICSIRSRLLDYMHSSRAVKKTAHEAE